MISDDALETKLFNALTSLANSDLEAAQADTEVEKAKYRAQQVQDIKFLQAGGNIEERKALARTSDDYDNAMDDYHGAVEVAKEYRNVRETKSQIIGSIRSIMANRRQGHVV